MLCQTTRQEIEEIIVGAPASVVPPQRVTLVLTPSKILRGLSPSKNQTERPVKRGGVVFCLVKLEEDNCDAGLATRQMSSVSPSSRKLAVMRDWPVARFRSLWIQSLHVLHAVSATY